MKIKDIKAALNAVHDEYERTKALPDGKYNADAAGTYWDSLPRIPYDELPDSLKRKVRDRFTADTIRQFLIECYPEHDTQQADGTIATGYVTLTAGIPEKDMQKLFIRTRNTAVYTIESQDMEPTLYGNHACDAAKKAGQIVSAGFYQRHISDKDYMHALTAERNKTAYVAIVEPGAFDKLQIDPNGIITYNKQFAGVLKQNVKGKYTDIADIDFPLLVQFYTAAFNAAQTSDANTVTVYIPAFFREMKQGREMRLT